jgi:hypothetical protein
MQPHEDLPFLNRRYKQYCSENLDLLCDFLGLLPSKFHCNRNSNKTSTGYNNSMKNSELKSCQWYMFKNIDCNCFGKRVLRYHITCTVGLTRVKMQFKPGQEFREFIYGNGFGKSLITFEGSKMFHIHRGELKANIFRVRSAIHHIFRVCFREEGNANDTGTFWERDDIDSGD